MATMNLSLPETLYLVQTIGWEFAKEFGRYRCPDPNEGTPVQMFTNRDEAEVYCAKMERETRANVNPFDYCETIDDLTRFDADRWHDWILDAGLEPPTAEEKLERGPWRDWWEEQFPKMTELQWAKMWQALDQLRFYRVIELQAASGW